MISNRLRRYLLRRYFTIASWPDPPPDPPQEDKDAKNRRLTEESLLEAEQELDRQVARNLEYIDRWERLLREDALQVVRHDYPSGMWLSFPAVGMKELPAAHVIDVVVREHGHDGPDLLEEHYRNHIEYFRYIVRRDVERYVKPALVDVVLSSGYRVELRVFPAAAPVVVERLLEAVKYAAPGRRGMKQD